MPFIAYHAVSPKDKTKLKGRKNFFLLMQAIILNSPVLLLWENRIFIKLNNWTRTISTSCELFFKALDLICQTPSAKLKASYRYRIERPGQTDSIKFRIFVLFKIYFVVVPIFLHTRHVHTNSLN